MQGPEDSRPIQPATSKPARRQAVSKGAPPPQGDTLGALGTEPTPGDRKDLVKTKAEEKLKPAKAAAKSRTEPLNFRVTNDFRRAFKRAAAAEDCKKVELLERIFAEWSARNPG